MKLFLPLLISTLNTERGRITRTFLCVPIVFSSDSLLSPFNTLFHLISWSQRPLILCWKSYTRLGTWHVFNKVLLSGWCWILFLGMWWASQVVLVVKNPSANARIIRDKRSIPGSGRSPGGGNGNPLQFSCLENPMDKGAWRAMVHRVTKSQTWLKWLSTHRSMILSQVLVFFPTIGISFFHLPNKCQ